MASWPVIALLTDFGLQDHYVGVMKGVIYNIAPEARIVDIGHDIYAGNIIQAAYILMVSYSYLPEKTIKQGLL